MLTPLIRALQRKERVAIALAAIMLVFSGTAKAIIYYDRNTEIVPGEGGEFREGVLGQPVLINPIAPSSDIDRDISRFVFSNLVQVSNGIKKSDDGKTWNVRLKENVFWHDGKRLTSDDVIFTINAIENPESRSLLSQSFVGVKLERVSELELKFILPGPYAFFEDDLLTSLEIIPKHIFADIPVENFALSNYRLKPVGSGPFRAVSYSQDKDGAISSFSLTANKNYFGEKPNLSKFTFKFYKNEKELFQAYNSGSIDGFGLKTAESLSSGTLVVRHNSYFLKSLRYYAVFLNAVSGPKDEKVRAALSGSVQREKIVNDVFVGHAAPLYGPTEFSENLGEKYDPDALKGIELNVDVPDESFLNLTSQTIKDDWQALGAKINLRILEPKDQQGALEDNDYQAILFGNTVKPSRDLLSFWHSSKRFYPGKNLSLYQNKKLDEKLESYQRNFDEEGRRTQLKAISDVIASDRPAIFLYSPDYVYVSSTILGGFDKDKIISVPSDRFGDIEKWFVKTKRVFK